MTNHEMELKRKESINCLIDELRNVPLSANFYLKAYYTVAKIGLQLKAKEEKLFENEEWISHYYLLSPILISKL